MKRTIIKFLSAFMVLIILAAAVPFSQITVYAAASAGNETALRKAVSNGGDIKMTMSIQLTSCLIIPGGTTVTLDLNGKTLDRGLSVCQDMGSVIIVERGATLTVKDSEGKGKGTVTGGAAMCGGGICNYGTLVIESCVITGNKAQSTVYGMGGGIYSDGSDGSTATLTVKGGTITGNSARVGGGIYNGSSSAMTVRSGSYMIRTNTYITNLSVTGNKATLHGGGIYSAGTLNMQDKPKVTDNEKDDVYLTQGKVIGVTGAFEEGAKIGVMAQQTDAVITSGYGANNTAIPNTVFITGEDSVVMLTAAENGEVRLKNSAKTTVQVFTGDKLSETVEYETPQEAWDKAVASKYVGKRVEITLGSDWKHDIELYVESGRNIALDLNGHYILRTRNLEQTDNGGVFRVAGGGLLMIKDSSPDAKGYDGLKGGVIAGGASENTGGGVHVEKDASFYMDGGTIYECVTCYNGGGICAEKGAGIVSLSNCRLYYCQTIDSLDSCHGGGIYANDVGGLYLRNVTVQDCYSENNGGAICHFGQEGNILSIEKCKFIGNKCRDNGGALYLSESIGFRIDSTTFSTNKAEDYGGAIYLDQLLTSVIGREPIIIDESVMSFNESGSDGSAIYVNKESLTLSNDTITDNAAGGYGSVYVNFHAGRSSGGGRTNNGYDISVTGRTIIRDNEASDADHKDIVLSNNILARNFIYAAGLEEGSYISFSALETGEYPAIRDVSAYQLQYFHPEKGTLSLDDTEEVEAPIATASLFAAGSYIVPIILLCFVLIAFLAVIAVKKYKGGKSDESTDEK